MADSFVFQDGSPAAPAVPVVTGNEDTDGLLAIKSALIALQFQAAAQAQPDVQRPRAQLQPDGVPGFSGAIHRSRQQAASGARPV